MKVMYLITDLSMGGAEIQVMRMCQYMTNSGKNVIVVSMMDVDSNEMVNALEERGCILYSLNLKRGEMKIAAIKKFVSIVKKEQPKVIHSHMVHANLFLRIASLFFKTSRMINTVHGEEEFLGKRRMAYRVTDFLTDYTVCCGEVLYKQAREYRIARKEKLRYICNGLNTNQYRFDDDSRKRFREEYAIDDCFVWITVGRLNEVKNHEFLIREFRYVVEGYPSSMLIIVGDGPLKDRLNDLAKEVGIGNRVIFTGKRSDISQLLSCADAFVLSSVHEGLPLSLQEAGAVGLPMVSTNVGGCNEVISEGMNGYLCESNKEYDLSNKMLSVMRCTYAERMHMANVSRKIVVDKFDINNVMKEWEKLYV